MELIGTPDLCYINKVCVLISLYTLLPFEAPHRVGPGQNAPVAPPPLGGPETQFLIFYHSSLLAF